MRYINRLLISFAFLFVFFTIALSADAFEQAVISPDGKMVATLISISDQEWQKKAITAVFLFDNQNKKCTLLKSFDDSSDIEISIVGFSPNSRYLVFTKENGCDGLGPQDTYIYDTPEKRVISVLQRKSLTNCISSNGLLGAMPVVNRDAAKVANYLIADDRGGMNFPVLSVFGALHPGLDKYYLFDLKSKMTKLLRISHGSAMEEACFSHDGRLLVLNVIMTKEIKDNEMQDELRIYDTASCKLLKIIPGNASCMAFAQDDSCLVTYGEDKLSAWSIESGQKLWQSDFQPENSNKNYLAVASDVVAVYGINSASYGQPDSAKQHVVAIIDLKTGLIKNTISPDPHHKVPLLAINLSPDGKKVSLVSESAIKQTPWQHNLKPENYVKYFNGKKYELQRKSVQICYARPSGTHAAGTTVMLMPSGEKVIQPARIGELDITVYDTDSKELVSEQQCNVEDLKAAILSQREQVSR